MDKKVEVEISLKDNMSKQLNALSQSVKFQMLSTPVLFHISV